VDTELGHSEYIIEIPCASNSVETNDVYLLT
jgi:hypothetical protein